MRRRVGTIKRPKAPMGHQEALMDAMSAFSRLVRESQDNPGPRKRAGR